MVGSRSVCHSCREELADGTPCGRTFTRLWNLHRHIRVQHGGRPAGPAAGHTFVVFQPSVPRRVSYLLLPYTPPAVPRTSPVLPHTPPRLPRTTPAPPALPPPRRISIGSLLNHPHPSPERRQWSCRGNYHDPLPAYETKTSRRAHQQKGVAWLTHEARQRLDRRATQLMGSWGVAGGHAGTCVLLTSAWAAVQPEALARRFEPEACISISSPHVFHREGDHITLLSRAEAWFSSWPRTGVELDNLIECGPFVRHDGSHTCHNSLCVNPNHVTWEPCDTNQSRTRCCDYAVVRRRNGLPVPAGCSHHDPPCLLQHAALTTLERVLLQIWVLREARGLPQGPAPRRPRWHNFPTFEHELPVRFCEGSAVRLEPQHVCRAEARPGRVSRPELVCPFCPSVRSFTRVVAYWAHLSRHPEQPEAGRLAEVRRTAASWQAYSKALLRPSPNEPTTRKVRQALQPGFQWRHVEEWGMRT